MGRLIDIIKGNLFWVVIGLSLVAMLLAWQFVSSPMAERISASRTKGDKAVGDLKRWAGQDFIPTQKTIEAAKAETQELKTLFGQLELMFAGRGSHFDANFKALRNMQGGAMSRVEAFQWAEEYRTRVQDLLAEAKERLNAPDNVMLFPGDIVPTELTLQKVQDRQRIYWSQRALFETLARVNRQMAQTPVEAESAETAAEEPAGPLNRLLSIRPGQTRNGALRHPWLQLLSFSVQFTMRYEHLHPFIAALQNAPRPLLVSSFSVTPARPAVAGPGPTGAVEPAAAQDCAVAMTVSFLEFLPEIHTLSFDGPLFKDAAAVQSWIRRSHIELLVATQAVAQEIDAVRREAGVLSGTRISDLRENLRNELEARQKRIEENAPEELEKALKQAREFKGSALSAAEEAEIRKKHAENVKQKKENVSRDFRARFQQRMLQLFQTAGGIPLLYDYLHPLIDGEAYTVGRSQADRRRMLVRLPVDAALGGGRWWLFESEGAVVVRKDRAGEDLEFPQALRFAMGQGSGNLKPMYLDVPPARKGEIIVLCNPDGVAERLMIARAGGGWILYPAVTFRGEPVGVGDVAFRYGHVVHAAAQRLRERGAPLSARTMTVTPKDLLESDRHSYQIDVVDRSPGGARLTGTLAVSVGKRK
jgi:hypothetical protein